MSPKRRVGAIVAVISAVLLVGPPAHAHPFVLDGAGGARGQTTHAIGEDTANAVFEGDLFVFHHDETSGDLRTGRRTHRWRFQTLDGAGGTNGRINANVGWTSKPRRSRRCTRSTATPAAAIMSRVVRRRDLAVRDPGRRGGTAGRTFGDVGTGTSVTSFAVRSTSSTWT